MKKNKYITIIILVFVFILFAFLQSNRLKSYDVLAIISPFEIIADTNKNGVPDDSETILLKYKYDYISKNDLTLGKKLGLDEYTCYAFAYLTEKFVNDVLMDKRVQIKGQSDDIVISKERLSSIYNKSGLFFENGKPINNNAYERRLNQIKKSNFILYNAKSSKYHKLTCKYGRLSHNYVLLASYQIPKGAKACKFCFPEKNPVKQKTVVKKVGFNGVCSSGCLKIFISDYTTHLIPNRNGNTDICNELVRQIDNSKATIDIAIYGYDRVPKIEKAIKRALSRGVKIRLVHDITSSNTNIYSNTFYFSKLIGNSACDKAPKNMSGGSVYTNSTMHDKFYIFDNSVVMTGSANLSHTDMSDYNSNVVLLIKSKRIAEIFTKEFDQMYNGKFHNLKCKIPDKANIQLINSTISVYFSPTDNIIQNVLIPAINRSKRYVYIPIFAITDRSLADALINARRRGVDVRVIVDATNARNKPSIHNYLRANKVSVKTENYAGKLHSKSIIIDDTYSIIGSMNFSKSGNTKNDENIILLKDSKITSFYRRFFEYLWRKIPDFCLKTDVGAEGRYSVGSCSDGIDNDYDGKTDMEDEGCRFTPASKNTSQKP